MIKARGYAYVYKRRAVKKTIRIILLALVPVAIILGAIYFFQHYNVAVLNPQGEIADKQRNLIVFTVLLSMVVIVPVYIMLVLFAWKYRESNKKAKYRPNWDNNKWLETLWWGIPCVIILILSVITWQTSHELDPYKALNSNAKPINIQVVALQWKWLFIYPDQGIASVNLVQFPEKTPLNFTITSDAPMNAFWIPSLGSQVYAMSGMSAKLHLMANTTGDYKGSSTNISGKGFADMTFTARSSSQADFDTWVEKTKHANVPIDMTTYEKLAQPSMQKESTQYILKEKSLYDKIVMKYMTAPKHDQSDNSAASHEAMMHDHPDMMNMPEMEGM